MLRSKFLSRKLKERVKTVLRPILLYVYEMWTINKKPQNNIEDWKKMCCTEFMERGSQKMDGKGELIKKYVQ